MSFLWRWFAETSSNKWPTASTTVHHLGPGTQTDIIIILSVQRYQVFFHKGNDKAYYYTHTCAMSLKAMNMFSWTTEQTWGNLCTLALTVNSVDSGIIIHNIIHAPWPRIYIAPLKSTFSKSLWQFGVYIETALRCVHLRVYCSSKFLQNRTTSFTGVHNS